MSCREYFTCKNCGFSYMDVNYYFCFKDDTGLIEKYESLFSTVNYSDGSIIRGRVIQHYCRSCDKVVSVYQTGLGSSLFSRESTIDFLREFIPKKRERLLKTSVLLNSFVDMVKSDAGLIELNDFLKEHDDELYYKVDLDDFLGEKPFESMDFHIRDYIKEEALIDFDNRTFSRSELYNWSNKDLNRFPSYNLDRLHSRDLDLKSLYGDISNHLSEISAKDLNRDELYSEVSSYFDYISYDLKFMKREIPCINYYGDEFNVTLDGEEVDCEVCPECGEEFYIVSPQSPCPKCGKKEIDYHRVFFD